MIQLLDMVAPARIGTRRRLHRRFVSWHNYHFIGVVFMKRGYAGVVEIFRGVRAASCNERARGAKRGEYGAADADV